MAKRVSLSDAFDVLKSGLDTRDSVEETLSILVLVDAGTNRDIALGVRDSLVAERSGAEVCVLALTDYATPKGVIEARVKRHGSPDACIILCGDNTTIAGITAKFLGRRHIPVALVAETSLAIPEIGNSDKLPITPVFASTSERVLKKLANWLISATDKHMALASNFAFCRNEEISNLTNECALQCAAIGAFGFIPGADFPVMCANQSKLALQIAAIYGHDLNLSRAVDIAGVVGAGFAWRALARSVLSFVPGVGWVVKAVIGYAGTRATAAGLRAKLDPESAETGVIAKLNGTLDSARGLLSKITAQKDDEVLAVTLSGRDAS